MKPIFTFISLLIGLTSFAQYNIDPMNHWEDNNLYLHKKSRLTYYKDTRQDLNNFEGTWKYESGNTSLTLELEKVSQIPAQLNGSDMVDDLIGEYKYVKNGEVLVNSLSNLNGTNYNDYEHLIGGAVMTTFPDCVNCIPNRLGLQLVLKDPGRNWVFLKLYLRYVVINGQEKLEAEIYSTYSEHEPGGSRFPEGYEFVLTKQ